MVIAYSGCLKSNTQRVEGKAENISRCDSILKTFKILEWPQDSTTFSMPEYSYDDQKSIFAWKEEVDFSEIINGFDTDHAFAKHHEGMYFKEGIMFYDSCQYLLLWKHQIGTSIELQLHKISSKCDWIARVTLAKSLWIPGLKISQSSILKNSGELIVITRNIDIELDNRSGNIAPDTTEQTHFKSIACE